MHFLNNIKLSVKIPAFIVVFALIASITIAFISYIKFEDSMIDTESQKLEALLDSREHELSLYLRSIEEDLVTLAANPFALDAFRAYSAAWNEMGGNQTETLQKLYITDNPNPTGAKELLDYAPDGSSYSQAHAKFHPWFRQFLKAREYYDIFLFDTKGNLVYTVFKELDYATNLNSGEWKDTDLSNAFRAALEAKEPGEKFFFDFKPYAPSNNVPASFIATPIFNESGRVEAVLAFQMPISRINSIMQTSKGMGKTGETYIVGDGFYMRSDSRFSKESTILKQKVETDTVKAALAGKQGVEEILDYRGQLVISAYNPFEFNGVKWALIGEIDVAEAMIPVNSMRDKLLIILAVMTVAIVTIGYFIAQSLTKPISRINSTMTVLSKGDVSVEVPDKDRGDEVGDMAKTLEIFKQNKIEADQMAEQQRQAELRAVEEKVETDKRIQAERKAAMQKLADDFEASVGSIVQGVASAATELRSNAEGLTQISASTNEQAATVASATEEASVSVQTVAAAAEELSSSITEISRQVNESTRITNQAVQKSRETNATVSGLSDAAEKIGDVVKLIQDIAGQTNLLALNATIEAARAGDAGKGFAVVASEVKNLANQTEKATEDISRQIGSIQHVSQTAVVAIEEIGGIIERINEITTAVAAAVEEQTAATQEIAQSTEQASAGTREVASSIIRVTEGAQESGAASNELLGASAELSQQAERLRAQMATFLNNVRNG